jgi:hypothetical protein
VAARVRAADDHGRLVDDAAATRQTHQYGGASGAETEAAQRAQRWGGDGGGFEIIKLGYYVKFFDYNNWLDS